MRLKVVTIHLSSLVHNFTMEIECLVVNQPPARHPEVRFARRDFPYLDQLALADTKAGEDSPIDILIGANALRHVLRSEPIVHPLVRGPSAISTEFGWVLMGHTAKEIIDQFEIVSANRINVKETDSSRFWEQDQLDDGSDLKTNPEQREVLRHFRDATPDRSDPTAKTMSRQRISRIQKTGLTTALRDFFDDRLHFHGRHRHIIEEPSSSTPIGS